MPTKKAAKRRLDEELVQRGLARDRKEAQALVLAGQVLSGDTLLSEAAKLLPEGIPLRVRGRKAFASRAGDKLQAALEAGAIDVKGLVCLDLGASTGGFTHCLLQHGASKVYAVEKGHQQLAYALTKDPRVVSWEHRDALQLQTSDFAEPLAFVCADLSFTSLKPFWPLLARLLPKAAPWAVLVKPQFELPASKVPAGGVVRDEALRGEALERARKDARAAGLSPLDSLLSPLAGAKGNREWLLWGKA